MDKQVFVSYTTPDKGHAYDLVEYLEKGGISCFIAPRDIDPGKPYAKNIMSAIENCEFAVLICSDAVNKSEHVLNEVDVIVEKNKHLIPFFLEEFEMSDDFRYYTGRKQRILAYPDEPQKYYRKLLETIAPDKIFDEKKTQTISDDKQIKDENRKTIFEYIPERGIMINPEDMQRNVSFRTDTLISMFSEIYQDMREKISDTEASEIFFKSGYSSGANFAKRLNDQWSNSYANFQDKLSKWCEFDSNVGWGRFSVNLDVDVDRGTLSGTLSINECFIIDKHSKCKICSFIRGYCNAVIEVLCDGIDIELECQSCPMTNKFKSECVMSINMKEG